MTRPWVVHMRADVDRSATGVRQLAADDLHLADVNQRGQYTVNGRGMDRYVVLAASVAIQLCLGGVYAWSVFVTPLVSEYGFSTAPDADCFWVGVCRFYRSYGLCRQVAGEARSTISRHDWGAFVWVRICSGFHLGGSFPTHPPRCWRDWRSRHRILLCLPFGYLH
jgi:hypothetical protein